VKADAFAVTDARNIKKLMVILNALLVFYAPAV